MEEIKLIIDSPKQSSLSVDDPNRREVLWETRLEDLCKKWKEDSLSRSAEHDKKAREMKRKGTYLSIPSIVIPLILSGISNITSDLPLVNSSLMAFVSILTGVNVFFNFPKKQQQHFEYSAKFFKLSIDVEKEMSKRKKNRIAADVYLEKISNDYNNLTFNAPPL